MSNIKSRIKKIERETGAGGQFCRCGTPYIATFVVGGENVVNNICPECGRAVKPETFGKFIVDADRYEYEVLEPEFNENQTKTL